MTPAGAVPVEERLHRWRDAHRAELEAETERLAREAADLVVYTPAEMARMRERPWVQHALAEGKLQEKGAQHTFSGAGAGGGAVRA